MTADSVPSVVLPLDDLPDLTSTLASGQCFRWRIDTDGRWTGVIGSNIVRLSQHEHRLKIESSPTPAFELINVVQDYLRLDDDLPRIQSELANDEKVREGIEAYPHMRLMRQDPWETLAAFILSSTSNIPRISKTVELLADSFGDRLTMDDSSRCTFAKPDAIAAAGERRLRELGCGFRAPYLQHAAEDVASGKLDLRRLRGAAYPDILETLTRLYGVGDKIADCVMLFSLDRLEAFPADRWVRKALVEWYGLPPNINYEGMRRWALDRFGANAGYANQYLFWNVRQSSRPMRISQ